MSNGEIRKSSIREISIHFDRAIVLSFCYFAMVVLIILFESVVRIAVGALGYEYHLFSLDYYAQMPFMALFLIARIMFYITLVVPQLFIFRRYISDEKPSAVSVYRYVSTHRKTVLVSGTHFSFGLLALRLLVFSPACIGIYGISYFSHKSSLGEISLFGLVCFMLSIGFTIVWTGVTLHYSMSLSLVKYIHLLNPRVNFFDACDLSVKLMEGHHFRLVSYYVSLIPLMLPSLFIYPLIITLPVFLECDLQFAKQIMGRYWQDKLPAMAHRWEKQQARKEKAHAV